MPQSLACFAFPFLFSFGFALLVDCLLSQPDLLFFFFSVFSLQGIPGVPGKRGKMGRPVKFFLVYYADFAE